MVVRKSNSVLGQSGSKKEKEIESRDDIHTILNGTVLFYLVKNRAHWYDRLRTTMLKLFPSLARSIARAVRADTEVRKILARHPRFFLFIKNRLTPDEMFGLHLTIGISVAALCVYIFFVVMRDVISSDPIIESDTSIVNFIQLLRSPGMDAAMMILTILGKGPVVFAGIFLTAVACWVGRRWHYLICLFASIIVAELSVSFIGTIIESARPSFVNTVLQESPGRFPPGHAFVAFTFYGLLTYILFRAFKSLGARLFIIVTGTTLIVLIGFSRIYLGIHWPADVLASLASAVAWLAALITILEIRRSFTTAQERLEEVHVPNLYSLGTLLTVYWMMFTVVSYSAFPLKLTPTVPEPETVVSATEIPDVLFTKLPRYSETLLGKRTEPINMIIVASDSALQNAFTQMGWRHSDPITPKNLARAVLASIRDAPYLEAPGTPTFWNARPNDFSFQKATPSQSIRERHHAHVWKTSFKTDKGENVWFLTAHFDKGIKLKSALLVPTHRTDPAIDTERDAIREELKRIGAIGSVQEFTITEPTLGKNIVGDHYFTDGRSLVITLQGDVHPDTPLSQFERLRRTENTP